MLKSEIKVGAKYLAKVNGKRQVVIVDDIITADYYTPARTRYQVQNLNTKRFTYFRSAAKFIEPVLD